MVSKESFDGLVELFKRISPNKEAVIDYAIETIGQHLCALGSTPNTLANQYREVDFRGLRKDDLFYECHDLKDRWIQFAEDYKWRQKEIKFLLAIIARLTDTHHSKKVAQIGQFLDCLGLKGFERFDEFVPVSQDLIDKFLTGKISREEFTKAGQVS